MPSLELLRTQVDFVLENAREDSDIVVQGWAIIASGHMRMLLDPETHNARNDAQTAVYQAVRIWTFLLNQREELDARTEPSSQDD